MQLSKYLELDVHPWYVRDDFLEFTSSPQDENLLYFHAGVNGIFTEFPHMTVSVFEREVNQSSAELQFMQN